MPVALGRPKFYAGKAATANIAESTRAVFNDAAAAQPTETATIPSKFRNNPRSTSYDHGSSEDMARRSLRTRTRKTRFDTTSIANVGNGKLLTQYTTQPSGLSKSIQSPKLALPEVPNWLMHMFAACLTFSLVVAVVLYLAQFPPDLSWLRRWKGKGYIRVLQDEHQDSAPSLCGRSSAVVSDLSDDDGHVLGPVSGGLKRRKARHLSIDTKAEYRGLGIAVPGTQQESSTVHERRSYDTEALRERPVSPVTSAWETLTAPLPSAKSFIPGHRTRSSPGNADAEIETGRMPPSTIVTSTTPELFDTAALYFHGGRHAGYESPPGSAIFRTINDSISHVADRLSRKFHDQITGPEEGLLLPVHNSEREAPVTPGMFVS